MNSWIWRVVAMSMAFHGVSAVRNVTVDDTDPSINYIGTWTSMTASNRYGGTSHYTKTDGSSASFTFTGATQVHFMGLGMTNGDIDTDMRIVLDGRTATIDIWRDEGQQYQAILWSSGTLDPTTTHTITCQKISDDGGGRDLYIDAFVMTVPDTVPAPQTSRASSTAPSTSASTGSAAASSSTITTSSVSNSLTQTTVSNASTTNSAIVWNPSNSGVTVTTPSLDAASASGTSGSSSANTMSSDAKSTPTAAIVGGVFGVIVIICIIAAIFFYLGRKRGAKTEAKVTQPYEPRWNDPNFATSGESTMALSDYSAPVTQMKGMANRDAFSEGSLTSSSPISEDPTSPRMARTSIHPSERQSHVSESRTWMMANPPAYTPRPISGHLHAAGDTVSDFTISPRNTSTQYSQRLGEVKEGSSLLD
ncbi:hypothetical protein FRC14_006495 [Serendipita sp. 396]|nr:hypothetical protein FRC14_006495 [Serendipita sp. 396]KAG8779037.1 hypothetical protein FRC15_010400 [Serendipita sp. 397]KAG8864729.1 hypothetical protein FRC20_010100 [Serendipita sp. 405]